MPTLLKSERWFLAIYSMVFVGLMSTLWVKTKGQPGTMDQTETYEAYNAARNFVRFGLANLKTVHDDATSPKPAAHPFHYTHYPIFPMYLNYLLLKLGIEDIAYHHLLAIPVLFLGLLYSYLFLRLRCRPLLAASVCTISLCNYMGVLLWGLNLYRCFSWPLLWGCLVHREMAELTGNRRHRWTAMGFLFLAFYFDWAFTALLIFVLAIDTLINTKTASRWKGLIELIAPPLLFGAVLRFIQVSAAIGWKTHLLDIVYTLGNRAFGKPSRDFIIHFYQEHHLTLWGYDSKLTLGFLWSMVTLFYERATSVLGYGAVEITIAVLYLAFRSYPKKPGVQKTPLLKTYGFFFVLLGATLLYVLLSPLHAFHMFIHPFFPFFVFPMDFAKGILLLLLFDAFLLHPKKAAFRFSCSAAVLFVLITFIYQIRRNPWEPAPGIDVLPKYAGHSFYTNYNAWYTSYFTKAWSGTAWGTVNDDQYFNKKYVNEADKNPYQIDPYDFPEYLFCFNNIYLNRCQISGETYLSYPIREEGKNFLLLDVSSRRHFSYLKPLFPEKGEAAMQQIDPIPNLKPSYEAPGFQKMGALAFDNNLKSGSTFLLPLMLQKPWGDVIDVATTIEFDSGAKSGVTLNALSAYPSWEYPDEFFFRARLEGSWDRSHWTPIVRLGIPGDLQSETWLSWVFPEARYRHFRIILSPIPETGVISFAELRLGTRRKLELP